MPRLLIPLLLLLLSPPLFAATQALDRIAAVVDQDIITTSELEARLRSLRAQSADPSRLPGDEVLRPQVLERLIIEKVQLARAQQRGITVDDERLGQIMQGIAESNGLDLQAFRDTLANAGIDFADFREELRSELILKQLRQQEVINKVKVSAQEVEAFMQAQAAELDKGVEYHLGHILVAIKGDSDSENVSAARKRAEQLLTALRADPGLFAQVLAAGEYAGQAVQASDLGWRAHEALPTLFVDAVPGMQAGEVSELLQSPSGFHIVKLLERRGGEVHMVQQVHARHILIQSDQLTSEEQAKARLEDLRERILAGEDFAELARSHSADTGSATQGGDLGWAGPGHFVSEFEKTVEGLAPGAISPPFKTQFGWHIVQLLERREVDNTDEFRRQRILELLTQQKAESELERWLRQLRDQAYVDVRLNN